MHGVQGKGSRGLASDLNFHDQHKPCADQFRVITAASMGWEVAVFFTFYGLDIIHKKKLNSLKVAPMGNPAMPAPFPSIPIQVPNILGVIPGATALATAFMKRWMARAKMPTVPQMIEIAKEIGVQLYACSTTMGMMGVKEEDLLEGIKVLGAAAFLDFASEADTSLFV